MKKKIHQITGSYNDILIEHLRKDPAFAEEYLKVAMEEAEEEGGQLALLQALKYVAEARGMAKVAKASGIPRESMYRALSPKGNPRMSTLFAMMRGMGMQLTVRPLHA